MREQGSGYLARPAPSGLADVIDIVLDKGIVIDAYVRVSLVGIELLTIDARIVVASVDTYLRFAEATNRLDLYGKGGATLPDVLNEGARNTVRSVASTVVQHKVEGAMDTVEEKVGNISSGVKEKLTSAVDKAGDLVEQVLPGGDEEGRDPGPTEDE
ncbi:MAG: gas vesicle protein GvpJ [Intrasporangium sp.]|uniref:gas vesicle protein GvpJ n=1 Tax=Intrasporangium sp. TaxID=1925024 RepID=UPI003F7DFA60